MAASILSRRIAWDSPLEKGRKKGPQLLRTRISNLEFERSRTSAEAANLEPEKSGKRPSSS
ncbi:hypothetical protein AUG19_05950 [archaeon 13_1_20CM_2_54_9]|nr:MAG: hypothetical protein AUG19_05950 [archaeon 13_1_20CM_2_54_9]